MKVSDKLELIQMLTFKNIKNKCYDLFKIGDKVIVTYKDFNENTQCIVFTIIALGEEEIVGEWASKIVRIPYYRITDIIKF